MWEHVFSRACPPQKFYNMLKYYNLQKYNLFSSFK